MSVRRFVIQLLRVVMMFVCGLTVSSACSQSDDARPGVEERRLSVAASATQSQGMPLVVVPPDSPRFKQLRIELVREQAFPTDEVVAPARVVINPNRISRVLPPVQGRILAVSVKLGDTVERGSRS